jgi:hypothetical protein
METGQELCSLYVFLDGTWAVVDPEGRYDGSNAGDVPHLHWVVGEEAIDISQLPANYEPGLLAKLIRGEQLPPVPDFGAPRLFPEITVLPKRPEDATLRVELRPRGGGLGRIVLNVNGSEFESDLRPRLVETEGGAHALEVDLSAAPNLLTGQENKIALWAYNQDGTLRSRGFVTPYRTPGDALDTPPNIWAVIVGSSEYRGDLKLRWSDDDARDFGTALSIAASRLVDKPGDASRVHVDVLRPGTSSPPTLENIKAALKRAAASAKPEDVLVVYLSGHGKAYKGKYYYLMENSTGDLRDDRVRAQTALGVEALVGLLLENRANKRVLILDTCAAGHGAQEILTALASKDPYSAVQRKTLKTLAERTGSFILAGCAKDRASYESSVFGQGLLTYSLLEYMARGALKDGEAVDVVSLFEYAADRVRTLASGAQEPQWLMQPESGSFAIGRLLDEDRGRIPLQRKKPVFRQSVIELGVTMEDPADLTTLVNTRLRELSAVSPPALLYQPASTSPESYRLRGRYETTDGETKLLCRLLRKGVTIASSNFSVANDDANKLAELADDIVDWAREKATSRTR